MNITPQALESLFPKHAAGMALTHNDHKLAYQTAHESICENEGRECPPDWENPEMRQKAIDTDEIWELHWYPDTPVGFFRICAPTLGDLLRYAATISEPTQ